MKKDNFSGTFREARRKIIKELSNTGPANFEEIGISTGINGKDLYIMLEILKKDMIITEQEGIYSIKTA